MVRNTAVLLLTMGLGGCMSVESGPEPAGCPGSFGRSAPPPQVPGVQGAWGQPVPVIPPYASRSPMYPQQALAMMNNSMPLGMVQMGGGSGGLVPSSGGPPGALPPPMMVPRGGLLAPPGLPFAPGIPPNGLPAPTSAAPSSAWGGNLAQAQALMPIPSSAWQGGQHYPAQRTQVRFARPSGMKVAWYTQGPGGQPAYSSTPIEVPGRYNFLQAAIYRLKLSNLEGRPGLELYPTLEVVPANHKTAAFLAHSAVPVDFTDEDVKQITQGNYVIKVIYLPDPQFQELAGTGTEEILSTRLEPGADPIQEALRRGSILLVIRMGNMDQEAPNTPPLGAPSQHQGPILMPPPHLGGQSPPNPVAPCGPGQPYLPYGSPTMPPPAGALTAPAGHAGAPTTPAAGVRSPVAMPSTTLTSQPRGPAPLGSTLPPPSGRGSVFTPKPGETPVSPSGASNPRPDTLPGPSLPSSKAPASGPSGWRGGQAVLPAGAVVPQEDTAQEKAWSSSAREIPAPPQTQVRDAPPAVPASPSSRGTESPADVGPPPPLPAGTAGKSPSNYTPSGKD